MPSISTHSTPSPEDSSVSPPSPSSAKIFWSIFLLLVLLSAVLRFHDLYSRPLHNDEGVNFYFLEEMNQKGYYPYSHENYHGPLYFYLTYAIFYLTEASEFGLRASAAGISIATLFLFLMLRRSQGNLFVLLSAGLFCSSTSLLYYARYAIHESLFVFSGLLFGLSLYRWLEERSPCFVYTAAIGLAMLITVKETFIVTLFSIGWGCLAFLMGPGFFAKIAELARKIYAQASHFCGGLLLCAFLVLLCFSGGFRWGDGLREMILAVPQWIGRNDSDVGHFKPFFYYLWMLIQTEPALLAGLLFPLLGLCCAPRSYLRFLLSAQGRLTGFFIGWGFSSFLVYSFLNYKTPWLIINISLPLALIVALHVHYLLLDKKGDLLTPLVATSLSIILISLVKFSELKRTLQIWIPSSQDVNFTYIGIVLGSIIAILLIAFVITFVSRKFQSQQTVSRISIALFLLVLATGADVRQRYFVFQKSFGEGNPFSYVHTSAGMIDVVRDIQHYRKLHPQARVLIAVNGYWPLPFYLREISGFLGYLETTTPDNYVNEYDIMLLEKETKWNPKGWAKKYYRLSDVEETNVFFKRTEGEEKK